MTANPDKIKNGESDADRLKMYEENDAAVEAAHKELVEMNRGAIKAHLRSAKDRLLKEMRSPSSFAKVGDAELPTPNVQLCPDFKASFNAPNPGFGNPPVWVSLRAKDLLGFDEFADIISAVMMYFKDTEYTQKQSPHGVSYTTVGGKRRISVGEVEAHHTSGIIQKSINLDIEM